MAATAPGKISLHKKFPFNEQGGLFLLVYLVIFVLLIAGAAFVITVFSDNAVAERQLRSSKAFLIAQAGMNRALNDLYIDYLNSTNWTDGNLNGITAGPNTSSYYALSYGSTTLNSGSYTISVMNVAGANDQAWVRSVGTFGDATRTIVVYAKMVSLSPWNNAIFAGTGASGMAINGNVDIHGSVHILGNGLLSTDYAMDMSGSGKISNNYSGLPTTLSDKIPAIPTTTFGGETVGTLNAILRVKKGIVGLSGTAYVGETNVTGNTIKETVDAVYASGFGGNQGTASVYSDNGYSTSYDMGDALSFPSLSTPYAGYATYKDYLKANALVLDTSAQLTELANITPNSSFSYSNANGSISMDGNGNMTVSGIVYVDGGDVNLNIAGSEKIINYTGKASLFVSGNVNIDVNLYTAGNNSYPTNILGVMTPNNMTFNAASIDVMGLFYAENKITVQKQTDVVGALVTNYFDLGTNVPRVYYVPSIMNNFPAGLIGTSSLWQLQPIAWQEQ